MADCERLPDDRFGPLIRTCPSTLDFTLLFEQSILSIPVSSIWLLIAGWRLAKIWRRAHRVRGKVPQFAKLSCIVALVALQLSLVVLWSTTAAAGSRNTPVSLSAAIIALVLDFLLLPLSVSEHTKTIRPSATICSYLLVSFIFDLPQVRTLWLIDTSTTIQAIFSATLAVRLLLLLLESIPKRRYIIGKNSDKISPDETCGIISHSFHFWLIPLLYRGFTTTLSAVDLYANPETLSDSAAQTQCEDIFSRLSAHKQQKHRLVKSILKTSRAKLFGTTVCELCVVGFNLCQPLLLLRLIRYVQAPVETQPVDKGYGLIGAYAIVFSGIAVCNAWSGYLRARLSSRIRGLLMILIYDQTLNMSMSAPENISSVSILSDGINIVLVGLSSLPDSWISFIQAGLATYLLEREMSFAGLVPLSFSVVCGILLIKAEALASRKQLAWTAKASKRKDLTSRLLRPIESTKLLNSGTQIQSIITDLRSEELRSASSFRQSQVASLMIRSAPLLLSPVLTFAVYVVTLPGRDAGFDSARTFPALIFVFLICRSVRKGLRSIPDILSMVRCLDRAEEFVLRDVRRDSRHILPASEPKSPKSAEHNHTLDIDQTEKFREKLKGETDEDVAMEIYAAVLSWQLSQPVLTITQFKAKENSLTMVIGPQGCGKSTLLKAILGEVPYSTGIIRVRDKSIAYCDQSSWVMNTSLKQNIIMMAEVDEVWYARVLYACDLEDLIDRMPDGEDTIVGSTGFVLSEKVKKQLSLARALYARRQLNVFDDVFAGLDQQTERKIWPRIFGKQGLLRNQGATMIMTTSSPHMLHHADHIVCLSPAGVISEQGTYRALRVAGGYLESVGIPTTQYYPEIEFVEPDPIYLSRGATVSRKSLQLPPTQQSQKTRDHTGNSYYRVIGILVFVTLLLSLLGHAGLNAFQFIWIKWWSDKNRSSINTGSSIFIGIYALLQAANLILLGLAAWLMTSVASLKISDNSHKRTIKAYVEAPYLFFQRSSGQAILEKINSDIYVIDNVLSPAWLNAAIEAFIFISQLLLIMNVSYYIAISFPIILGFHIILQRVFVRTARPLQAMIAETTSALCAQFTDTVEGLPTIRAFPAYTKLRDLYHDRVLKSQQPFYLLHATRHWLILVTDCFAAGLVLLVVGLIIARRDRVDPGFVGIALVCLLHVGNTASKVVFAWAQLSISLESVKSLDRFQHETPIENNPIAEVYEPQSYWPKRGSIQFEGVSAARHHLKERSLHKINFSIKPGEKIAILGSRNSGMSLLLLSMFLMVELHEGRILIDGTDISTVPRGRVRDVLNCVPAEPSLLPSSIRTNLNSIGGHITEELMREALVRARLWDLVTARGGIDVPLRHDDLSTREKQQLCLARAMVKGKSCRILVVDQRFADSNPEAPSVIQDILREEFAESTIITFAQQSEHLTDYDKVAIINGGRLEGFNAPELLHGRHFLRDESVLPNG